MIQPDGKIIDFDKDSITLSAPSNPRYLKIIRSVILQSAMSMNFCEKNSKDITLAVDEAMTNVIKHAYNNDHNREIIIRICFYDDKLKIIIRDFGKKADPETIKPRQLNDIKPGGLGVFFIKKIMDEAYYDTSPDSGTILTMTKYITSTSNENHSH